MFGLTLHPDWRQILTRAWSMWCMGASLLLHLATEALPYVGEIIPWWLSLAILAVGMGARLIKQRSLAGEADEPD